MSELFQAVTFAEMYKRTEAGRKRMMKTESRPEDPELLELLLAMQPTFYKMMDAEDQGRETCARFA